MNIKRPALVMFLFIIYSIITAYLGFYKIVYVLGVILSLLALFLIFKDNSLRVIFIICALFSVITYIHTQYRLNFEAVLNSYSEQNINFTAKLIKPPTDRENRTQLYVNDITINDSNEHIKINEKILVNVYDNKNNFVVGDYYNFYGKIKIPKKFDDFDYNLYLKTLGIYNYANVNSDNVQFVKDGHLPLYLDKVFVVRDKLKENLMKNVDDEDNVNLLMGIMFSDKSLSEEIKEDFNEVGLSHVLAVSGLHVGLIYALCLYLLSMLKIKKRNRIVIISVLLFIYVVMAGMSVSALRAMFLCILNELFSLKHGKDNDSFNNLLLIAILLLMINPLNLFNVSFTLSFSAVLGIIMLSPVIDFKIFYTINLKNNIIKYIKNLFCVSISAYLFTLPIIINSFKTVSVISIIGNFLVVPLIAPIMIIAIIGAIFSDLLSGMILLHMLNYILTLLRNIISYLSNLPFATVTFSNMNLLFIIIYYVSILVLSGYIKIPIKKKDIKNL